MPKNTTGEKDMFILAMRNVKQSFRWDKIKSNSIFLLVKKYSQTKIALTPGKNSAQNLIAYYKIRSDNVAKMVILYLWIFKSKYIH